MMDARPFRSAYGMTNRGNENLAPAANKTQNPPQKSASSLLNSMPTIGGPSKFGTKFDPSNEFIVRAKPTGAVGMDQENRNYGNPKEAFLQPAQRPPKSLVPSSSTQHLRPLIAEAKPKSLFQPQPISKQYPVKRGAPIVVYNDNPPPKENLNCQKSTQSTQSNASRASTTSRYSVHPHIDEQVPREGRADEACTNERSKYLAPYKPSHNLNGGASRSKAPSTHRDDDAADQYIDAVEELPQDPLPALEPKNSNPWDMPEGWRRLYISSFEPQADGPASTENSTNHAKDVNNESQLVLANNQNHENQLVLAQNESQLVLPSNEDAVVDLRTTPASPLSTDRRVEIDSSEGENDYDEQGYATAHSGFDNTTGITTIMVPPQLTLRGAAEIQAARIIVEDNRPPDDEEEWDISMVAEYGEDIFKYMREVEAELAPSGNYMDFQTEIKWSMRSLLMDWVIQVHCRFGLLPETLFLAVNYIDRFLSVKIVSINKLQLVGATAILIAAKYEEINCPSVQEIVYMVDGGYSQAEVLKAERFMLTMLNFQLGWPGPMSFMRRISKADDYDNEIRTVAKYFLEVTIMDERFVASPPSYIAAGAQCLARMILGKGTWSIEHVHYSGYTYTQLKPLVAMMLDCCRSAHTHHNAVYDKYSNKVFRRASVYVEERILDGFSLPYEHHFTNRLLVGPDTAALETRTLTMPIPLLT